MKAEDAGCRLECKGKVRVGILIERRGQWRDERSVWGESHARRVDGEAGGERD
jgi:hypothetical protein